MGVSLTNVYGKGKVERSIAFAGEGVVAHARTGHRSRPSPDDCLADWAISLHANWRQQRRRQLTVQLFVFLRERVGVGL